MLIILPAFALGCCISAICVVSLFYCKSKVLNETTDLGEDRVGGRRRGGQGNFESSSPVFIVPTTSQVMDMYLNRTNLNLTNDTREPTGQYQPPSYSTTVADVPPSYEQAISNAKTTLG